MSPLLDSLPSSTTTIGSVSNLDSSTAGTDTADDEGFYGNSTSLPNTGSSLSSFLLQLNLTQDQKSKLIGIAPQGIKCYLYHWLQLSRNPTEGKLFFCPSHTHNLGSFRLRNLSTKMEHYYESYRKHQFPTSMILHKIIELCSVCLCFGKFVGATHHYRCKVEALVWLRVRMKIQSWAKVMNASQEAV